MFQQKISLIQMLEANLEYNNLKNVEQFHLEHIGTFFFPYRG